MRLMLRLLTCMMMCSAGLYTSLSMSAPAKNLNESFTSASEVAPKSISDIVQLLKDAKSDTALKAADEKLILESPAPGLSQADLYTFLFTQVEAAERMGRTDKKIAILKKATEVVVPGSPQDVVINQDLAFAELAVGNSKSAIERMVSLLERIPNSNKARQSSQSNYVARIYATAGDFPNAKKYLDSAESILISLRSNRSYPKYGWMWNSQYYRSLGSYAQYQGRFDDADIAYKKSIDFTESGIASVEDMFASMGGVPGVGRDSDLSPPSAFKNGLEAIYRNESSVLLRLRKINEAEFYARKSLLMALERTGKSSIPTSAALRQLANVMLARDRNKDAIYLLNQAIDGYTNAGATNESIQLAQTKKSLASALIADQKYAEALKIFVELDKTIATYPETGRFIDTNSLERILALTQTGSYVEAEKLANKLLISAQTRTGPRAKETLDAKLMLATTLAEQKKDSEAKTLFAGAMSELIDQEREIAEDSEGASAKEKAYQFAYIESFLAVLSRSQSQTPNPALIAQSFELGDIARSSGVQRALNASTARANITDPKLAELARKEQDLNQQITFLSRFVKELSMAPANQQLPQVQANIKKDLQNLRLEAKKTFKEIEKNFPEYADLISPKPVSLANLQKTLRPNEVLVTWFIGKKSSYVWAVSKDTPAQFKAIPLNQEQLKKMVTQLRKALDPNVASVDEIPAFNFVLANQLYDSLFTPVQTSLEGKNTLVVVPQGDVASLPLGVLITSPFTLANKEEERFSSYRAAPWLIKKYALVSIPSATALNSLRSLPKPKEGRFDFIGFGDPIFSLEQAKSQDKAANTQLATRGMPLQLRNVPNTSQVSSAEVSILPRLPDTKEEILEVAKVFTVNPNRDIFLEKRATLEEVMKTDMSNRKVVMFSTHGLVPGELNGLTQPALALTNPAVLNEKGDGLLKVDQILNLKLNADWVVLSACNTAAGEGDGAEALSGLGRAFFYAGARSLLVSSWPVDSQASRKLMVDLFQRQAKDQAISKPQALQQASLAMLDKGKPDDKDSKYTYAHPLFWAPFMVVGD
ncbi:CHAT domain-containing protein [Polynucleobacter sp. IMCC30063]|uniref:CHAT domain-containing protein n=1 Tax=Polynucleobacter sp. IMCC30063 TaxID=2907298 RepID=UPI001F2FC223|nr:CHAT domain-containing tetratricopeptide repeat protein [Polynucleobacter sp. IMCC30063]MCE7505945.1 CHAT domain-containing protein [Polynucleobacter sp. IMCC30063]